MMIGAIIKEQVIVNGRRYPQFSKNRGTVPLENSPFTNTCYY